MNSQDRNKGNQNVKHFNALKLFNPMKRAFTSKQGILYDESLNLLFHKLGITESEINAINKKSLSYARATAVKFAEESKKGNKETLNMIKHIAENKTFEFGHTLYSKPAPQLTVEFDAIDCLQHGSIHVEGNGNGLRTREFGGNDDQRNSFEVIFTFPALKVPIDGFYHVRTGVWATGQYQMFADDGACNSKEVSLDIQVGAALQQDYKNESLFNFYFNKVMKNSENYLSGLTPITKEMFSYFEDGGQNINKMEIFSLAPILFESYRIAASGYSFPDQTFNNIYDKPIWLFSQFDINLRVQCTIQIMAKGEGSLVDVNCSNSGGVYCPGVTFTLA